jgi:hypothetical protein
MRRLLITVCVLVLVLGGCGREAEPTGPRRTIEPSFTASSPSPKATAKDSAACKLLTSDERRSIAGERIDIVAPSSNPGQCRWVKTLKASQPTSITVLSSSAQDWVRKLPGVIDGMIAKGQVGDKDIKRRLFAARKLVAEGADKIGNKEACDLFGLVVEANSGEKNIRTIVIYLSNDPSGSALAQTCTRGRYTSLVYTERNLVPSRALKAAVLRVMGYAHERAIKRASK